jgi:PhnB protein
MRSVNNFILRGYSLMSKAKQQISKQKKQVTKKPTVKRKKVLPIPKGYHSVTPYLIVSNGAKAIEFYKKVFGAKASMCMEQPGGKIGHAELKIGDSKIMLADGCPEMKAHSPEHFGGSPVTIHLYVKDVDAVVKSAVAAGAKLVRPLENMFYGDRSAGLQDPYGHQWYVATHIEDVTPAQMKKRAAELFGK